MSLLGDPALGLGSRFRPTISAAVPSGWSVRESITIVFADPRTGEQEGQLQANVIASSEPLAVDLDTERYARIQGDVLRRDFPNYRELSFEEIRVFGGNPGYMRRFAWQPEGGVDVTQLQIYLVREGRGYTATATATSAAFHQIEAELLGLLRGLSIEREPTAQLQAQVGSYVPPPSASAS